MYSCDSLQGAKMKAGSHRHITQTLAIPDKSPFQLLFHARMSGNFITQVFFRRDERRESHSSQCNLWPVLTAQDHCICSCDILRGSAPDGSWGPGKIAQSPDSYIACSSISVRTTELLMQTSTWRQRLHPPNTFILKIYLGPSCRYI